MPFFEFLLIAYQNVESALRVLIENLLIFVPTCSTCGNDYVVVKRDMYAYVCNRSTNGSRCNRTSSIFSNSIFANTTLSIYQIFSIIDSWRKGVVQEIIAEDLEIAVSTVSFWYRKMDNIVGWSRSFETERKLGGPGCIVELDECLAVKRKYNRGRILSNQVWIFGGVERGNPKNYFIEVVSNRKRTTLLEVIRRRVRCGSIVMTDLWKGYANMTAYLFEYNLLHLTVNHSVNFVDPFTRAHTQSIEGFWSLYKRVVRRRGTNCGDVVERIQKFHIFRFLKENRVNAFEKIVEVMRNYTLYEL